MLFFLENLKEMENGKFRYGVKPLELAEIISNYDIVATSSIFTVQTRMHFEVAKIAKKVSKEKNFPRDESTVAIDEIDQELITKYSVKNVEIKKGDVLFFDTKLFHRSGKNITNRVRFSCQTRHSIITSKDFVPFRESKLYVKSVVEEVALKHPAFSNNDFATY